MSNIKCLTCGYVYDGCLLPLCPMCNIKNWEVEPDFIRDKHNPSLLPLIWPDPRSVVTMAFITDKDLYINTLAQNGVYFYDNKHHNISCVVYQPLGITAGSAIPKGYSWPTRQLDSQIVVDIFGSPHVYAIDSNNVKFQISKRRLSKPRMCEMAGCPNLAVPGTKRCKRH